MKCQAGIAVPRCKPLAPSEYLILAGSLETRRDGTLSEGDYFCHDYGENLEAVSIKQEIEVLAIHYGAIAILCDDGCVDYVLDGRFLSRLDN